MSGIQLAKRIILFVLIITIGTSFSDLFSQNATTKPTRQSSLEAFSKGDYEGAFLEFSELLETYSKDPLYKYYSGICLVKLGRDTKTAVTLLSEALQGASVVRTLPSDARFYLGKAQQMSGSFKEAAVSYSQYADLVGRKAAKEQNIADLLKQCEEGKGAVKSKELTFSDPVTVEEATAITPEKTESDEISQPSADRNTTADVSGMNSDYEEVLNSALYFQSKSDSVYDIVRDIKKDYDNASAEEKQLLKSELDKNELLADSLQREADKMYDEAQKAMNTSSEVVEEDGKKIEQENISVVKPASPVIATPDPEILKQEEKPDNKPLEQLQDTSALRIEVISKSSDTFALFEIKPESVADTEEKVPINPKVPDGLIYRIQVAVFRNPVTPSYFKGIIPVYGFRSSSSGLTTYYAGLFRKSADANKALVKVKDKGFKDAFVTPFFASKSISADRASTYEKEWGMKPFAVEVKGITDSPKDTVAPTLSFRVEIKRSLKPVSEDVLADFKRIAGKRRLDVIQLDDGNITYLIGLFITFDSAAEYADLLIRNGYSEAVITAWLGRKEIPVEIAKQLFENL